VPCDFFLPVTPDRRHGYAGRRGPFAWPDNVHEIPAGRARDASIDAVLFQSSQHYLQDQHEVLSARQRALPRLFLEHDCPRQSPVDQRHVFDDPDAMLIHVTPFNALMWDSARTPVRVIEHGVAAPTGVCASGELARGLVIMNGLTWRGRRAGLDLVERVRREVPLDIVGMESEQIGGLGEIPHNELPRFAARYRFVFHPARYTSLGLAVCEAMMLGLPVVGMATTELVTVIRDGVSGYIDTSVERLIPRMRALLEDRTLARRLGEAARGTAQRRFAMTRFVREWLDVFAQATSRRPAPSAVAPSAAGRAS
jgi:hypothetical protein